jgi:hypothetical protein
VPEFIFDRYYSKTARVVAVICLIIASVTYVIGQMKGIGVAAQPADSRAAFTEDTVKNRIITWGKPAVPIIKDNV